MKNKWFLLLLVFTFSQCQKTEKKLNREGVHQIMSQFTNLRFQYQLYADKVPSNFELFQIVVEQNNISVHTFAHAFREFEPKIFKKFSEKTFKNI